MNRHVNAIAGRLSLRPPQRESLEILDRVTEIVPPKKGTYVSMAIDALKSESQPLLTSNGTFRLSASH
jgi:type III restriction enzyme